MNDDARRAQNREMTRRRRDREAIAKYADEEAVIRDEDINWRFSAKCHGDDLKAWVPHALPQAEPLRAMTAKAMCSGCPVFKECAKETLRMRDTDVIRAGQALRETAGYPLYEQYNKIRDALGQPRPDVDVYRVPKNAIWPRECLDCARTMRPTWGKEEQWPETVVSHSKIRCAACELIRAQQRQQNGKYHGRSDAIGTADTDSAMGELGEGEAE